MTLGQHKDKKGRTQTRGLADLAKGVELKSLGVERDERGELKKGASTYNTINGYIKRSSKRKANMKILIFDNSENPDLEDAKLIEYVHKSQAFRRGRAYILDHDGNYRFIR